MGQIGEIKARKSDGTIVSIPVWDNADSPPAGTYKYLRVKSDEATAGFVGMSTTGDIPAVKINHPVHGVLMPVSALGPSCPSYTLIDGFASSPGNFIGANFSNLYGSPGTNFTQVASPVPTCGESGQSLEHATTTASTCFSNASYWTAGPGSTIELFAQFSGTGTNYNIVLIYFGATSIGNTYRAFIDWGNSIVKLQKGGSDLITAAITSRPTGQFCNIVIDYRDSSASDMTVDLLDDVNGTSLIGGPISSNDTTHTGARVGLYVKSSGADPIYVNALRTVP